MATARSMASVQPPFADDTDNVLGFLPLSHVFERIPVHYFEMYIGITKFYADSMETLLEDINEKQPTIMFAVPRVLEKIYQKMSLTIREKPPVVQKLFAWAQEIGNDTSQYKEKQKLPPLSMRIKHKVVCLVVFKKLQSALSGRILWMCAAGAPIARDIVNFFNATGIFVLEGHGMSELSGGACLSNLNDFRPGSVWRPLPGIDIKIADDGEILVKGDVVSKGYWKLEAKTKESYTHDGYLKTGDIGKFDENGLLYITDRKKDLLITSGGKDIATQKIESLFKNNPLFTQFVVIGEGQKHLTALMTLDLDIAARIADENHILYDNPKELIKNMKFHALVHRIVEEKIHSLPVSKQSKNIQSFRTIFLLTAEN
jgi:long-chain acyl-CoA synthetase